MATSNGNANKLTKDERETVAAGLKMLYRSAERSAKSAASGRVKDAYEAEMGRINALAVKVHNMEIEL